MKNRICWALPGFRTVRAISWVPDVGFGWSYSPREAWEIFFNLEIAQKAKSYWKSPETERKRQLRILKTNPTLLWSSILDIGSKTLKTIIIIVGIEKDIILVFIINWEKRRYIGLTLVRFGHHLFPPVDCSLLGFSLDIEFLINTSLRYFYIFSLHVFDDCLCFFYS